MLPGSEALLRAQLAQRLDALLRQPGAAITGPQPASAVGPVHNDPRLPSRATHDRAAQGVPLPADARQRQREAVVVRTGETTTAVDAMAAKGKLPGRTEAASPTQLSATARALVALMDTQAAQQPSPVRAAAPLWTAPAAPHAPELARVLAQAVEESGLFYEAHLQQFAQGTRTLGRLQREPQAGLSSPVPERHPAAPADPPTATAQGAAHAAPIQALAIHASAVEVVQQQLQLLASGVFRWSGEPWPDARMEMQIGEDRTAAGPDGERGAWSTRLQVVLPALGEVDATVWLDASGALRLRVGAALPSAARELQTRRGGLLERLDAAGFKVQACQVQEA